MGRLAYNYQEYVESLGSCHVGGYHPVHLQDEYSDGRYWIVHKLGFGTYSTVWLAKDQHTKRYVALKIIVAESSKANSEIRILHHLDKSQPRHTVGRYVNPILDEFYIDGPNGRHLCLVSEPARCSVATSKELSIIWMFRMDIARAVAAQAVLGLQYIHSCGVVHGDLYPGNILLRSPDIKSSSVEEIYQLFGEPQRTMLKRMDGRPCGPEVPSYSVMPAQSVVVSDEVTDPRIMISDFGMAWLSHSESRDELQTPLLYRPPEDYFSKELLGTPADVWTLGCTIYEILGDGSLLEGWGLDKDDTIAEMVSCLGMLPRQWWNSWQAREEFFLEDGSWKLDLKRCHSPKSRPLLLRIQENGRQNDTEFSTDEVMSLEKMLGAMLIYDPRKRATAREIAGSDWMIRWGLPALERFS